MFGVKILTKQTFLEVECVEAGVQSQVVRWDYSGCDCSGWDYSGWDHLLALYVAPTNESNKFPILQRNLKC